MYNKSEIMKNAWNIYRDSKLDFMGYPTLQGITFSKALKQAWADAKTKAADAKLTVAEKIEKIENQLFYLEMKDRWNTEDYAQQSKWRTELTELRTA